MADLAAARIKPDSPVKPDHPAVALWHSVGRVDKGKINEWWMALRNALAVAIPLAVGIGMGNPLAGVAMATGALNVSFSDGRDLYLQRAQRMLMWSLLSAVAVFVGSICGRFHVAAVLVLAAWAIAAGMMLGISTRAGDLGLNTLVTVMVFESRGVGSAKGALYSGLLVLGGGLLQTLLALLFWPVRRNKPQLMAIGKTYRGLAIEVDPDVDTPHFVPIHTPDVQMQDTLTALGTDHSVEGERFRLLYDQADRLRLSIYLISRLRDELGERDSQRSDAEGDAAGDLDNFLKGTSTLLNAVADVLITGADSADFSALRHNLVEFVERAQARKHNSELKLGVEIANAMDVLVGQLRLVVQLTINTTERGEKAYLEGSRAKPWKLQTANWRATMRANLTWKSPVFRHAVRLCVCVALADSIGRSVSWERSYWLPMTVAVVLKPDFTTTFSRGALRLGGTIAGLLMATLICLVIPLGAWSQLALVGAFTFMLRYLGPANYGVFTVAISGLIVFLLSATGVSPSQVVAARGMNTVAGGLLALLAYAVWPTWERATIADSLAEMLDAMRAYFRAVSDQFAGIESTAVTVDEERTAWRLKRSAAEASVDRVSAEPGNIRAKADCLHSIMASSHALVHAVMGMEAELGNSAPNTTPGAFRTFSNDVEFTLYALAAALRGSKFASDNLPQLREDHRRLLDARGNFSVLDDYVLIETDRLTVSLNTLREQVARYVSGC